jgi:hypothetical protein
MLHLADGFCRVEQLANSNWQLAKSKGELHQKIVMNEPSNPKQAAPEALYCPTCAVEVTDPLTCGDCSAVICRICGTPLESAADLGMG